MASPTGFSFNNVTTNDNVALEDAMTVALTAPVYPPLLAALFSASKVLEADTTFYVSTTGSDTTGDGSLANPWRTIAFAIAQVATYTIGPHNVTIQLSNGSYIDDNVSINGPWLGTGSVTISGDNTTPSNVNWICTDNNVQTNQYMVQTTGGGNVGIKGIKFSCTTTGAGKGCRCLWAAGGKIYLRGNIEFGANSAPVISASWLVENAGFCGQFGLEDMSAFTITYSGNVGTAFFGTTAGVLRFPFVIFATPNAVAISIWCQCVNQAQASMPGQTFTGKANVTGQKYVVSNLGLIVTNGGGINYFPGTIAGTGTNTSVSPWGLYN